MKQEKMERPDGDASSDDRLGIQVISRAASILRVLGKYPNGLGLSGIAVETGLPRSTVQRLIGALEIEQFVEKSGPQGGSRLGPALGQLIHTAHGDIVAVVRPHLQDLADTVSETVALASIVGRRTIMVDRIIAERELCIMISIGMNLSPHTTSAGKALLAQLPDEAVRAILGDTVPMLTDRTVKNMDEFLASLAVIRDTGFAYSREENQDGICSIAVALETFLGPYAATITVPALRFEPHLPLLQTELLRCKKAIELKVGKRA